MCLISWQNNIKTLKTESTTKKYFNKFLDVYTTNEKL